MSEKPRSLDELARLQHFKQSSAAPAPRLGDEMVAFFKQSVARRQTKFGKIAECWGQLVPQTLLDHCALESFSKGQLGVIVDSAAHLYELKQLLLSGLEAQLKLACRSAGLRKITLKRGRWYDGDDPEQRPKFS